MKNIRFYWSNYFQFLEVKFSIYLNRPVFVILDTPQEDLIYVLTLSAPNFRRHLSSALFFFSFFF